MNSGLGAAKRIPFNSFVLHRVLMVGILLGCLVFDTGNAVAQNDFVIDRNTLEAWIFQRHGNRTRAQEAFKAEVDLKLSTLKRRFELTDQQEATLRLAASGDIKRFLDMSDALTDVIAGKQVGQNDFNDAWELTMPLQNRLQKGLFEEGSLFQKVLLELLDHDQAAALEEAVRESADRKRKAVVRSYIAAIERSMPLTAVQRQSLEEVVLARLQKADLTTQYALYVVAYALHTIPKDRLKEFLDEQQMKAMEQFGQNAQAMQAFLKQQGLILEDVIDE